MLNWKFIRTIEDWMPLSEEWNHLLACSASHVPFLRHEYLTNWWRTLGGGEWKTGNLAILAASRSDNTLVGAAPLFLTQNREGENAIMLIGSIEISDYLDFLVCNQALPHFFEDLFDQLANLNNLEWQVLDFYNILDSSATIPFIQEAASKRQWRFIQEPLQHCPYIPLPGDWETYLGSIDKKQRHEIRRKMRRAEEWTGEWGETIQWYIVQDSESLESEMDDFMDLMAQDDEKARFLTPQMRQQNQLAARAAFDNGWLQLAFLTIGGVKAAGYLNFDYEGSIWVYNSGINYQFRDLSPGWVLLGYLLKWANDQKRTIFDFMRGEEEYKYRFGGIDRRVVRIRIWRN
jgi:CelD/BcsL family acetyltransferase involved in cellulose biosynthesis